MLADRISIRTAKFVGLDTTADVTVFQIMKDGPLSLTTLGAQFRCRSKMLPEPSSVRCNRTFLSTDSATPQGSWCCTPDLDRVCRINETLIDNATNSIVFSAGSCKIQKVRTTNPVPPATTSQTVTLPDATTLPKGWETMIISDPQSTVPLSVRDSGGNVVATVPPGQCKIFTSGDNAFANGEWCCLPPTSNVDLDQVCRVNEILQDNGTTSVILTSASCKIQKLQTTPSATPNNPLNQVLTLPNATTVPRGWQVVSDPQSTQQLPVLDAGGNEVARLEPGECKILTSGDNSAAPGEWCYIANNSNICRVDEKLTDNSTNSAVLSRNSCKLQKLQSTPGLPPAGPSDPNQTVTLPPANTLPRGWEVTVISDPQSTQPVPVRDANGNVAGTLQPGQCKTFTLGDNAISKRLVVHFFLGIVLLIHRHHHHHFLI